MLLRDIVKQVQHLEMKLMAGEAGLNNEVVWTHMVDSDTVSAFLQGQELVFTTGLGLNDTLTLRRLVEEVWRNRASGIVVNIGPYIKEIGQDVLDFANEKGFPVFQVPWKIRMAEIMRIICFSVIKEQQKAVEMTAALNNAFLCPRQEELYVSSFLQNGYLADSRYTAVNIRVYADGNRITGERLAQLSAGIDRHLRCSGAGVLCCTQERQIILVFCDRPAEERLAVLRELAASLGTQLRSSETAHLCQSRESAGIRCLHESYSFGEKMADLMAACTIPGEETFEQVRLLAYSALGIYRVLLTLPSKEAAEEYLRDTVLPLYEYDALNHSDLVAVLQCYLRHDCSVKDTAQELVVHRNTVNYKLGKAAEVLGKDLSGFDIRFQLHLGFLLYPMVYPNGFCAGAQK